MNERQAANGKKHIASGRAPSFAVSLLPLTIVVALALRLLLWSAPLHQPANDEVEYIAVARDLLAGRGWQFYDHYHWLRAPLYPLFLAGSLWLAGGDLHLAALPNILLSVATVYLNYRLALALVGRRAALIAAVLSAVLWTLATFASLYMAETLFTFLFTAALLCLVRRPTLRQTVPELVEEQGRQTDDRRSSLQILRAQLVVGSRWSVVAAGIFFGLATLTRSVTLLFLPAVALWLLAQEPRTKNRESRTPGREAPDNRAPWFLVLGSRFLPAILFLIAVALTIAPWTIRNYQAYGRFIPVETGLSYNLWAFNEPREGTGTIFRALENIPNPAERSDYATAKGLERLREDPAILLRKLWPNWVYIARVKPIEDRFIQENYYNDVGLPLFISALIFDDALYFVIALAGIAGLVLYRQKSRVRSQESEVSRRWPTIYNLQSAICNPKWLLIAWVLYCVVTILLTHGEGRYRHFLFPVLIPYAAWELRRIVNCKLQISDWPNNIQFAIYNFRSVFRFPILQIAVLWVLFAGTFLAHYPWEWAGQNLARGWYAAQAELAWARGDHPAALRANEQALSAQETPDGWLRLAAHSNAAGDPGRARDAYNASRTLARNYPPGVALFGDFLRASGDEDRAREVFATDDVDQERLLDWAWRNLRPVPRPNLAIGDGLDIGYIAGMHPAEPIQGALARWTDGRAQIRFGTPPFGDATPARALVRLRLAALRPDGAPARAQVCVGGECWNLQLTTTWRTYTAAFDVPANTPFVAELRSDAFDTPDGRKLGVLVDSADVEPVGEN